jgi:hypothetical protein
MGVPPIYAVVFGVYGSTKRCSSSSFFPSRSLASAYPTYDVPASRLMGETADTPLAINKIALAGAITGLATVVRDTAQADLVVCCSLFPPPSRLQAFAAPAEAIKARLQVQYSSAAGSARYSGPVDCAKQMYRVRNTSPTTTQAATGS